MDKRLTKEALLKRLEALEHENHELSKKADEYREKHESVLESIEEGYYELDLKGNITSFNKVVAYLLGYETHELLGLNYRSYTSPDTARRLYENFHRIYEAGSPERLVNYEVIRKDGSVRIHEMSAGLIRNAKGSPVGFHILVHDITERNEAEKLLKKSEERFRGILETIEEAYYEVDLKGNLTFFNPRPVERLGYTPEELSGMNFRQYMDESNARKVYKAYHQVFVTGEPIIGLEWELRDRQGHPFYVEASVSLRHDDSGKPAGFRGVVRDVTERKKAENDLRASEEKYRGILESMQESYFEVDLKGNFTYFNDAAVRMSGYSREELLGMNYHEYSPPETTRLMFEVFHRVYETGRPELLVDYGVIHKDGTLRDNELSVWPMRDSSGSIVGFHALVRDVTRRKQSQKALKASEERWQFALEGAGDAVWDYDVEHERIFRSRRWKEMLGYAEDEIGESPEEWSRLVHPDDRKSADDDLDRHLRGETPFYIQEHRIRCRDGTYKWILDRGKVIQWSEDGKPLRIIGTQTDITDRKEAEEALRESERKYRLLAENLRDVIWVLDTDLKYVYVSPSVFQLRGFTPEEAMQQTMEQVLAPGSYERAMEIFSQERFYELNVQRHGKEWATNIELELNRKDGSTVWTEVTINLLYNEQGKPSGILGITRDITDRKKAKEDLIQSEAKYRFLTEKTNDVVWTVDLDIHTTYVSPSIIKILGYTPEERMAQDPQDQMTPDSYERAVRILTYELELDGQTGVDPDRTITFEAEYFHKDGSLVWLENKINGIRDDHGRLIGMHGVSRDITDRKKAEADLRKSEERYRTIFESTATANIIVAEDTTILLANTNFEQLTGYSRDEVEGKMSWTSFMVEDDLEMMKQRHFQRRVDPGSVPGVYEFRARNRSGEVLNLYMSVAIIPDTKESVASLIDMTDRKKAEDDLKSSEERFRDLARLLPETVFETDLNGRLTFANESSLERFGFLAEEVERGVSAMDLIAPQDHERAMKNFQRVITGELLGLNEYTARRKDGTTFPALIHTTPINRDGASAGLRGFLIDMSEKKSLEEKLLRAQKLESIGTLAGGIAHDFNNLLMGILGNISLMLMHLDDTHPNYDRLKNMEDYVQRGSDLTKQLLGFARGGKYEVKPTDLGEFVRRSAEMFGRTRKEIRMHHKAPGDLWTVEVDRGQMEQVMLNLFVNAWQAMPGGGDVYLSIENTVLDAEDVSLYSISPGRFVKLIVTDTGIGMDEDTRMRIFEPFFSTKERGRGTGLGLASVYGIIKNHGGFILVESEQDAGTSFMVFLPASQKEVEADNKTVSEHIHTGRETVLLIDDEEMILEIGARMLENLGYSVLTAEGGIQGIKIYDENREIIDFVILDMIMPDMGGKEIFQALLRLDPDVKVLLSSGYSLDGQAKGIIAGGCRGFIQKPFTIGELSRRIREILETL